MTAELGLNLAGVERVLDLEREIDAMHARIEEIETEALKAQVRLAEQLEEVRRSFRAELVPIARATSSWSAPPTRARRSRCCAETPRTRLPPEEKMQPDRFTIKSQEAIASSARLAQEARNPQVVPAHLMRVLLGDGQATAAARRAAWCRPCSSASA